ALTPTLSASGASTSPVLSDTGRYVAYTSTASNVVPNQSLNPAGTNIFLFDQTAQTDPNANVLVSGAGGSKATTGNASSDNPSLSTDRNFTRPFVAFRSDATDLVAGATTGGGNVFVFDPNVQGVLGAPPPTNLVSHTSASPITSGNGASDTPLISNDGSAIVFRSLATNLLTGEVKSPTNSSFDVYEENRASRLISLVSRNSVASAFTGNGPSGASPAALPAVSGDGRFVVYGSSATDLVAGKNITNGFDNVFLYDQQTLSNLIVSQRDPTLPHATARGTSPVSDPTGTSASSGGHFTAFTSTATNIVGRQGDPNHPRDVFLFDRVARTYTLVSHAAGMASTAANGDSFSPLLSSDGRYLAFL